MVCVSHTNPVAYLTHTPQRVFHLTLLSFSLMRHYTNTDVNVGLNPPTFVIKHDDATNLDYRLNNGVIEFRSCAGVDWEPSRINVTPATKLTPAERRTLAETVFPLLDNNKQPQPEPTVTLTVPLDVARTLRGLTGRLIGSNTSRRQHMDLVFYALVDAGVPDLPREAMNENGRHFMVFMDEQTDD